MTTPRDDIAGLIERLRDRTSLYAFKQLTFRHSYDYEAGRALLDEAATQLDSLLKERDALQARVKELEGQLRTVQNAAKTIAACQGTELEHLRQNRTFDHKLRAEHESLLTRDAMMTEALESAESRALRAEQERDEAYERAAKVAFARAARWKDAMEHEDSPCGMSLYDECLDIGAIIRRLSAGPEKEEE